MVEPGSGQWISSKARLRRRAMKLDGALSEVLNRLFVHVIQVGGKLADALEHKAHNDNRQKQRRYDQEVELGGRRPGEHHVASKELCFLVDI